MKSKELIEQAKAETAMFERPSRSTSCLMMEMIGIQDDRIAELEKELSHAQTMGDREQSIRDLEQQAKGVTDFANKFCGDCKTLEQASVSYCADRFVKALKVTK
jgi:hypothetical protein